MTQQFRIESESLRDKINSLLPSQARGSIDVDLTGSTTIIPIVDLTETAEGSSLRQDLQTALSHTSQTPFSVSNTTSTLVNTTGFFRVFGGYSYITGGAATGFHGFALNDGTTTKNIFGFQMFGSTNNTNNVETYDFIVELSAGDSLLCISANTNTQFTGSTRQIADINGNLV